MAYYNGKKVLTAVLVDGQSGGKSIDRIEKTSTSGLIDTYTIYYTDGTTSTYQVTNGATGATGSQGPKGDKGDTGATGATGATGNGISSFTKISTLGLVDTYRLTYTNGGYNDFQVTNGADGQAQSRNTCYSTNGWTTPVYDEDSGDLLYKEAIITLPARAVFLGYEAQSGSYDEYPEVIAVYQYGNDVTIKVSATSTQTLNYRFYVYYYLS